MEYKWPSEFGILTAEEMSRRPMKTLRCGVCGYAVKYPRIATHRYGGAYVNGWKLEEWTQRPEDICPKCHPPLPTPLHKDPKNQDS